MTTQRQQTEERVKRGFPLFWRTMQLGPPLSSGQPVRCPICYPIPGRTKGTSPYRCPYANPLVLVDTPETHSFYPAPVPTAAQAPPPRVNQKRTSNQCTSTGAEVYTDCMLCEALFVLPFEVAPDEPSAHTCPKCLERLAGAPTTASSSSSSKKQKKT